MRPARLRVEASDGSARAGLVELARGEFRTPCFMPVGTRGSVRLVDASDLEELGPQLLLANTYHLMLRPGLEAVEAAGGLGPFTGWRGLLLTDSGGYQVFSLGAQVDDDGVTFRSTYDGSTHRLTPEGAVAAQEVLGADIQMALDVCCALPSSEEELRLAAARTAAWAARARAAHRRDDQSLFGVVQGGTCSRLRSRSADELVGMGFDGYAVGGLSVGETRAEMLEAVAAAVGPLPADRPRYLMGVGDPVGVTEAVAAGIDMFDCVLPTRLARHGTALASAGRMQLRSARFARDGAPVDDRCSCRACAHFSRAYLRHLLVVGDPAAGRLLSIHNLNFVLGFFERMREAIKAGTFELFREETSGLWGSGPLR